MSNALDVMEITNNDELVLDETTNHVGRKPMMVPTGGRHMGVQSHNPDGDTIVVTKSYEWYVAKDEASGVASQGKTKSEALAYLAEALELAERPVPEEDDVVEESTAPWL